MKGKLEIGPKVDPDGTCLLQLKGDGPHVPVGLHCAAAGKLLFLPT